MLICVRPSLPLLLSLPDWCGRVDRSDGGGDLWSGRFPKCRCVNYLIRARLSHHMNGHGRRVDVCNSHSRRVPSPRVVVVAIGVVVAIAAAATVVVVGGGGFLGECGDCREVFTPQRSCGEFAAE